MYAQRMHADVRVLGLLLVCLLSRADSRLLKRLFWLGHLSAEPRCVQAAAGSGWPWQPFASAVRFSHLKTVTLRHATLCSFTAVYDRT